ncbi:MAG: 30S ribosomal protein S2, partial [Gemmatimonadales bacterium]
MPAGPDEGGGSERFPRHREAKADCRKGPCPWQRSPFGSSKEKTVVTAETSAPTDTLLKELLDAGLHFGHQTKRWNPKMKPFVFDKRNGIHIIDLSKSVQQIQAAREFLYIVVSSGRQVLFVGTKKQAQEVTKEVATRCGMPYVNERWLGGTLTNLTTIRARVKRMVELQKMQNANEFDKMPKKEVAVLRHELQKLERNLTGIAAMDHLPGALFV